GRGVLLRLSFQYRVRGLRIQTGRVRGLLLRGASFRGQVLRERYLRVFSAHPLTGRRSPVPTVRGTWSVPFRADRAAKHARSHAFPLQLTAFQKRAVRPSE